MTLIELPAERRRIRNLLSRFLHGSGIELGPGHVPYQIEYPGITVKYLDRWEPDENRALFPELGHDGEFPKPDIIADLDRDALKAVSDASQDFIIASHVLEHVANPLLILEEIYRVLAPGGIALILLPDRRFTFDSPRRPTPLDHIVAEYRDRIDRVSDAHLDEFLNEAAGMREMFKGAGDPDNIRALLRKRSIHVHCWTETEFLDVLRYSIDTMGLVWELLEASFATGPEDDGFEFGFVLRAKSVSATNDVHLQRFNLAWDAIFKREHSALV